MAAMTSGETAVREVLGLRVKDPVSPTFLLDEVKKGFKLSVLARVAGTIAPNDIRFLDRIAARSTVARLKAKAAENAETTRLSTETSARIARVAAVWALAKDVWGSDEEARAFLFRPHPMLEGRTPIDVILENEFGRPLVEGILGRLQYGSAA